VPILGLFSTPHEEEEEEDTIPLLVFVGRLVHQKGVDLICDIIPWLMSHDHAHVTGRAHVLLMGMGEVHTLSPLSLSHTYTHTLH
jgi:glycogen synthase